MLDWLIIGGGIHGTYMAHVLIQQGGVNREQIRILDPFERPLHRWRQNTANCGMRYLRSPSVHNLDIPILSLYQFTKTWQGTINPPSIPNYYRPALSLFNDHCDHVIQQYGLQTIRIKGQATTISPYDNHVLVSTTADDLTTRYLLLCLGNADQPCWPSWATDLRDTTSAIHHVFDPHFHRKDLPHADHTLVVGGGITAAQLALAISHEHRNKVTLCSRHTIRPHNLDFDPCWVGPKCLKGFEQTPYTKRREIVNKARNRGSVPQEIHTELNKYIAKGRIQFVQTGITRAWLHKDSIVLTGSDKSLECDQIVLATGFEERPPGGKMIQNLILEHGLPTAPCGYPMLEEGIRWGKRIFATGALAELGLGPCARNIIGVRLAGKKLLTIMKDTA